MKEKVIVFFATIFYMIADWVWKGEDENEQILNNEKKYGWIWRGKDE